MRTVWVVALLLAVLVSAVSHHKKNAPNTKQRVVALRTSRDLPVRPWLAVASIPPATAQTSPSVVPSRSVTPVGPDVHKGKVDSGPTVWDRLAWCESRGRWHINTGNGYYGGLQENAQFWRSYGDQRWARPDLAPKSAQIQAATRARDGGRGYEPWPQCAKILGLVGK